VCQYWYENKGHRNWHPSHPITPHCPKEKNLLAFDPWQALSAVSCRCSLLNYALKLQPKKKKEKEKEMKR
jgi:hypothetical protein